MTWRVANARAAFASGPTLRLAWLAAGPRVAEATQVGLGNDWCVVAGSTPEEWAVAAQQGCDLALVRIEGYDMIMPADSAEQAGLATEQPTAGQVLDLPCLE